MWRPCLFVSVVFTATAADHTTTNEVTTNTQKHWLDAIIGALSKRPTNRHINTQTNKQTRRNTQPEELKTFTDFLHNVFVILNRYNDKDLEDFAAIFNDEVKKYHYRGCLFYELTENIILRKFIATFLDAIKNKPAPVIRKSLTAMYETVDITMKNNSKRKLVNFVNSLYGAPSVEKFKKCLIGLEGFRLKTRKDLKLVPIIRDVLRTLVFDHYTQLNQNARRALQSMLDVHKQEFIYLTVAFNRISKTFDVKLPKVADTANINIDGIRQRVQIKKITYTPRKHRIKSKWFDPPTREVSTTTTTMTHVVTTQTPFIHILTTRLMLTPKRMGAVNFRQASKMPIQATRFNVGKRIGRFKVIAKRLTPDKYLVHNSYLTKQLNNEIKPSTTTHKYKVTYTQEFKVSDDGYLMREDRANKDKDYTTTRTASSNALIEKDASFRIQWLEKKLNAVQKENNRYFKIINFLETKVQARNKKRDKYESSKINKQISKINNNVKLITTRDDNVKQLRVNTELDKEYHPEPEKINKNQTINTQKDDITSTKKTSINTESSNDEDLSQNSTEIDDFRDTLAIKDKDKVISWFEDNEKNIKVILDSANNTSEHDIKTDIDIIKNNENKNTNTPISSKPNNTKLDKENDYVIDLNTFYNELEKRPESIFEIDVLTNDTSITKSMQQNKEDAKPNDAKIEKKNVRSSVTMGVWRDEKEQYKKISKEERVEDKKTESDKNDDIESDGVNSDTGNEDNTEKPDLKLIEENEMNTDTNKQGNKLKRVNIFTYNLQKKVNLNNNEGYYKRAQDNNNNQENKSEKTSAERNKNKENNSEKTSAENNSSKENKSRAQGKNSNENKSKKSSLENENDDYKNMNDIESTTYKLLVDEPQSNDRSDNLKEDVKSQDREDNKEEGKNHEDDQKKLQQGEDDKNNLQEDLKSQDREDDKEGKLSQDQEDDKYKEEEEELTSDINVDITEHNKIMKDKLLVEKLSEKRKRFDVDYFF